MTHNITSPNIEILFKFLGLYLIFIMLPTLYLS